MIVVLSKYMKSFHRREAHEKIEDIPAKVYLSWISIYELIIEEYIRIVLKSIGPFTA